MKQAIATTKSGKTVVLITYTMGNRLEVGTEEGADFRFKDYTSVKDMKMAIDAEVERILNERIH